MVIKPRIRSNVFTNAHPEGCRQYIESQVEKTRALKSFKGPSRVLIIGGSSGYGLSSRVALAEGAGADTINVSYEAPPKGRRTGTAGWWNNIFFQRTAQRSAHKDFVGDAFSDKMKQDVIEYLKATGPVDLVIYSLAAGARPDAEGNLVRSAIKPVGEAASGKTIDLARQTIEPLEVQPATQQEIEDTVYVMGGEGWSRWMEVLMDEGLLAEGAKTISYTYVGGETTEKIYRAGTLGHAKADLERTARTLDEWLKQHVSGEALISSSKAVVTKASVFIPQMPVYVASLFDVMLDRGTHESILEHKHRLFADMVYGDTRDLDSEGRLRMDRFELAEDVQRDVKEKMQANEEQLLASKGMHQLLEDFYHMNGFGFQNIDYEADVDLDAYRDYHLK